MNRVQYLHPKLTGSVWGWSGKLHEIWFKVTGASEQPTLPLLARCSPPPSSSCLYQWPPAGPIPPLDSLCSPSAPLPRGSQRCLRSEGTYTHRRVDCCPTLDVFFTAVSREGLAKGSDRSLSAPSPPTTYLQCYYSSPLLPTTPCSHSLPPLLTMDSESRIMAGDATGQGVQGDEKRGGE